MKTRKPADEELLSDKVLDHHGKLASSLNYPVALGLEQFEKWSVAGVGVRNCLVHSALDHPILTLCDKGPGKSFAPEFGVHIGCREEAGWFLFEVDVEPNDRVTGNLVFAVQRKKDLARARRRIEMPFHPPDEPV